MMLDNLIEEILNARENRWLSTKKLLEKYDSPLVSITLNIPGKKKVSEDYVYAQRKVFYDFRRLLEKDNIKIPFIETKVDSDGPEGYMIVDMDALELKKLAVKMEQTHGLGRLADIDVIDKDNKVFSRRDLGLEDRTCFLCDRPARQCILEQNHNIDEILYEIKILIDEYRLKDKDK